MREFKLELVGQSGLAYMRDGDIFQMIQVAGYLFKDFLHFYLCI